MMDNNKYFVKVYNDPICIKMLQMLLITCRVVLEVVQQLYNKSTVMRNIRNILMQMASLYMYTLIK